jgi:hydrogenase expression/formation protein HypD
VKYVDEFRDPALARKLVNAVRRQSFRPIALMEFCGGHTHAIFRTGLRQLLPKHVKLRSGPGCPVCVTSATDLERAIAVASIPGVILTTYGDMIRVPGSYRSLQQARAQGADVRVVYSVLDALEIARRNPDRQVVFLGIGFETTAPTTAVAILQAEREALGNFYVLCLHKLTPPATRAILDAGTTRLDGIIGPGHVTTIIGADAWQFLPDEYKISCVIAGFEPLDILSAVSKLVQLHEAGTTRVVNTYSRTVQGKGNVVALDTMARVFERSSAAWRGFGDIPESGLVLAQKFEHRDAGRVFDIEVPPAVEPRGCRCGEVLRGVLEPFECALFGTACQPQTPIGPCMVSSEGACAAHYRYGAEA